MAALFTGCDTGTNSNSVPGPDPKVCECPPNTKHKAGEKCCDGENCACEEEKLPVVCECPDKIHGNAPCDCNGEDCTCKQKFYTLNYGIQLEDQTNGALTAGHIAIVNQAMDEINDFNSNNMNALIDKGLKFTIISGNNISRNGSTIVVGIDNIISSLGFRGGIGNYLGDLIAYNFNSNIYLANGRTLNVGKLITFGKQFNDARNTVRIAFASRQRQGLQA
jgi:hypothetical protein